MTRVASTYSTVGFSRICTYSICSHQRPPIILNFAHRYQSNNRPFRRVFCRNTSNQSEYPEAEEKRLTEAQLEGNEDTAGAAAAAAATEPTSTAGSGFLEYPDKKFNTQITVISTLAAVGLFLSSRLDFGVSLKDLSAAALPYEEALSNGRPTVVEFYADWCEVCRELAPDVYKVEQKYKDKVNFVMLNVDNTKWEQELDEFGVEGIPHFAFLDKNGNEEGNVVGRLPKQYLLENVDALAQGEANVPHTRVVGQYSSAEQRKVHQVVDPRSHG